MQPSWFVTKSLHKDTFLAKNLTFLLSQWFSTLKRNDIHIFFNQYNFIIAWVFLLVIWLVFSVQFKRFVIHIYICDIWRIFFMLIDLTIKFHSHCTHFALSKCTGNVLMIAIQLKSVALKSSSVVCRLFLQNKYCLWYEISHTLFVQW